MPRVLTPDLLCSPASVRAAYAQLLAHLGVAHLDLCCLDVSAAARGATDPWPASVAAAWEVLCSIVPEGGAVGVAHAGWRTLDAMLTSGAKKPAVNVCELHPLLSQVIHASHAWHNQIAMD